jgi:hypothetical protein
MDDMVHEIDFILDNHEELRDKWEEIVEEMPIPEQLKKLNELAQKRREVMAPQPYISEKLMVVDEMPANVEKFLNEAIHTLDKRSREVDRGFNGRIMEYASKSEEPNVVYKILIRSPIGEQNDLLSEASYLADLYAFAQDQTDMRVGVPRPFYCATITDARIIAMQKVPGVSIENVIDQKLPIPKNFDVDALEKELTEFAERLNATGFYHNDMREGNIMVNFDAAPNEPYVYVIDTGNAKKIYRKTEEERLFDKTSDRVNLVRAVEKLRAYKTRQTEAS